MASSARILGVLLAGGQARRMGGGDGRLVDKGRLDLGGQSLIAEVIARLAPQCGALILNANGAQGRFADLCLPVVPDGIAGHPGPLAGILAGMEHAGAHGFTHVLSAAADTPFLPRDLAPRLRHAAGVAQTPIALAATRATGRLFAQPTFGLWPATLAPDLRAALMQGVSKVSAWAKEQGAALEEFATEPFDPFFNVNTPEDLEQARAIWQALPRG